MFYENSTSEVLKGTEQTEYAAAYHICDGLLYHYTKLDTLWKIFASDSFFARNIRFSNDFNEYLTGRYTIENYINKLKGPDAAQRDEALKKIRENPMMHFMVCFCDDGDLLSQWRGYAQNGVSIGMDFTGGFCRGKELSQHAEQFCVLNNKRYQDAADKTDGKYYINGEPLRFLQMPYQVQYISKEENARSKRGRDIKNILNKLYENSDGGMNRLIGYIPYIKDVGFEEEKEYRLIFDMEYLGQSKAHSDDVRSKKLEFLEQENLKKPYINVEFGNPQEKCDRVKTVWLGGAACGLEGELKKAHGDIEIKLVAGAGVRTEVCIGEGTNQEEIQQAIEKEIERPAALPEKEAVKIWCKGHLPIRKIIVGPGERQDEVKESMEYYKKTVYWLKYIDIDKSATPFRI